MWVILTYMKLDMGLNFMNFRISIKKILIISGELGWCAIAKISSLIILNIDLSIVLALIDNDHDEHFRNNEEDKSKGTGFSLHEILADCCFRLVNFQLMKFYEHNCIVFVSYLNYMSWGASRHDIVWGRRRFLSCLLMRCCVLERVLDLIIKLWLMFGSRHLGIMVTRNLWSARVWVRDWLCKGKTHHP
jgi:hypothetical protein